MKMKKHWLVVKKVKVGEISIKFAIDVESKNLLEDKEVFGKESANRAYLMISEAIRDMYPEDQPTGGENKQ